MLPEAVALKRVMRRILRQRARGGAASTAQGAPVDAGGAAPPQDTRRPGSTPGEASRRCSTSQPATDILSHLQELKAKERHVLGHGAPAAPGAAGGAGRSLDAEEAKSRQERLARDERLARQYRDQLQNRLQAIDDAAIDLGFQKTVMSHFERQMLGSSSPRELEQLELDRVNGVRALIGLPPLPPPPSFGGSVRHSRPGTPLYTGSSPSNVSLPSPFPAHLPPPPPPPVHAHRLHAGSFRQEHRQLAGAGDHFGTAGHRNYRSHASRHERRYSGDGRDRQGARAGGGSGAAQQAENPDVEEGEISEEGELLE